MASSEGYLAYVLDLLGGVPEVTHRKMMGAYLLYASGKLFGGIYDDRFLVKPTASAVSMMPSASRELPYEGAKEMLLVDDPDDRSFLEALLTAVYDDLPAPKKRK